MKRKTAMMMGAAAALATGPALAAPAAAPSEPAEPAAASYADLLQPIPNAVERLKIADMQEDNAASAPKLIEAQYNGYNNHHHHHHHHNRRWYMSRGYVWMNGTWVMRPRHHHHHHHNSYPPRY